MLHLAGRFPMTIQGVIAANRFGLGAKPGDVARISGDPKAWLLAQLTPERDLPAPLRSLPSTADDMSAFFKWSPVAAAEAKAHGMDPYKLRPQAASGAAMGGAMASGGGDAGFSI